MMDTDRTSLEELSSKRKEYTEFLENILQPQHKIAISLRDEVQSEIKEYQELRSQITILRIKHENKDGESSSSSSSSSSNSKKELESLVDLGHEIAYSRAVVPNPNAIFVNVGMGFHVEFTLEEAIYFINRRVSYLTNDVLAGRIEKVETVANHLKDSLAIMKSLDDEFQMMRL
eukprot:CAMPEP_0198255806 /NCGR_PEP_ID=MMETSP1447-20131203/5864_1 /TAXON_ID=420782 /ORGANISM="Chaetoceros dichaeta, Strain CCMP1751" /LENGTH=173 /DNA_ID=CAMNT_0043942281 /DNA_START=20 /DNA_END=541 /DNA_ORIENTATION=-